MPLFLIREDITKMKVDAIVNAANTYLKMGGGVCGAIFRAAGPVELQAACDQYGHCDTGRAVITPGFKLNAKYVIHTPGPVWHGGHSHEKELLASCYQSSLQLAVQYNVASIAFPLISGGIFGYPTAECVDVAVSAIRGFLDENDTVDMDVYLLLLNREALHQGEKLYEEVRDFIGPDDSVESLPRASQRSLMRHVFSAEDNANQSVCFAKSSFDAPMAAPSAYDGTSSMIPPAELEDLMKDTADTFSTSVLRLITASGRSDSSVYNRANVDRRVFSKLRSKTDYQPSRDTAIALCLSLELNLEESTMLLARAGYALSPASARDRVIQYCMLHGVWEAVKVDMLLFDLKLPTLTKAS